MSSHVIDLLLSGQFHIITHPKVNFVIYHLTCLTFQINPFKSIPINLLDQFFKSTIWINLRNQPTYWIGGATNLWYDASSDQRMYIGKYIATY